MHYEPYVKISPFFRIFLIHQKDELDIREGTLFNLKLSVLLAQRGNVCLIVKEKR